MASIMMENTKSAKLLWSRVFTFVIPGYLPAILMRKSLAPSADCM
ncbi:MAG: hypothetical protein JWO20_982 [Candidatus Angelobacter sp.]|nr:hypothetical protein [Candidatus Angelobacter sp.]